MRIQETNQILKDAEIRRHDHEQHARPAHGSLLAWLRRSTPELKSLLRRTNLPWVIGGVSLAVAGASVVALNQRRRKPSLFRMW